MADLEEVAAQYKTTLGGQQFLLYDSAADENFDAEGRVLVFATRKNLEELARSSTWFVDGTFKVCPTIFTQLFTIMGTVSQTHRRDDCTQLALPFVYALLSSKAQCLYEAVFHAVLDSAERYGIQQCQPSRIMSDFENAILNASKTVFPTIPTTGCMFHLGQNIYRHVQSEGLQSDYQDPSDDSVRKATHMLLSLAFLPPADVIDGFQKLQDVVPNSMTPILKYFDLNYLRGRRRRGR